MSKRLLHVSHLLVWAWVASEAQATQQLPAAPPPPPTPVPNPSSGGNLIDFFSGKTPYEFWLTCIIIAFGLIVIVLLLWGLNGTRDRRPEDVSRSLIVVAVITGSLILITAGYSNEQVAPAFGIFGTIVGYMLGRMSDARPGAPVAPSGPQPGQAETESTPTQRQGPST